MNEPHDIIQRASLTEKASLLGEKQNKYVFRVSTRANKIQIKRAIEQLFQKKSGFMSRKALSVVASSKRATAAGG